MVIMVDVVTGETWVGPSASPKIKQRAFGSYGVSVQVVSWRRAMYTSECTRSKCVQKLLDNRSGLLEIRRYSRVIPNWAYHIYGLWRFSSKRCTLMAR